jgi:lipoprotein NlpI
VDIKARNIEAAIQIFNQVVKFNVEYGDAYFSRGLAYAELGNQGLARVDLQKAVNIYQRQGKIEKYQNALSVLNHLYSSI